MWYSKHCAEQDGTKYIEYKNQCLVTPLNGYYVRKKTFFVLYILFTKNSNNDTATRKKIWHMVSTDRQTDRQLFCCYICIWHPTIKISRLGERISFSKRRVKNVFIFNFLFSYLSVVPQKVLSFIKSFEARQGIVKIKFQVSFPTSSGIMAGRVNSIGIVRKSSALYFQERFKGT